MSSTSPLSSSSHTTKWPCPPYMSVRSVWTRRTIRELRCFVRCSSARNQKELDYARCCVLFLLRLLLATQYQKLVRPRSCPSVCLSSNTVQQRLCFPPRLLPPKHKTKRNVSARESKQDKQGHTLRMSAPGVVSSLRRHPRQNDVSCAVPPRHKNSPSIRICSP